MSEINEHQGNRPDIKDERPKGAMFHEQGSTGFDRVRNIHDHKGEKSEKDFHHLYTKFTHDLPEDAE
jgi:hypothetical protein